jgi:hypothetical protein
MIDVSELINDPDFCQAFTVTRKAGVFMNGDFVMAQTSPLPFTGVIEPMNTRDMAMFPEGDTLKGMINVYTLLPIFPTMLNPQTRDAGTFSDEITWQGEQYKVVQVQNFSDFGYYKSAASRKLGA